MIQMLVEAERKVDLKPIEQIAKTQGFLFSYVAQNVARSAPRKEKKSTNPLNPSPSGDPWWDDPRNVAHVDEGLRDLAAGRMVTEEDSPIIQRFRALAKQGKRENVYV